MPVLNKLEYLDETKQQIKTALNQFGAGITDSDTFRSYASKIDNIHTNWPRVTDEDVSMTLDNTKKGKMELDLKGNTYQEGTPTPDTPQEVHVVSGDNEVVIYNKNLVNISSDNQIIYSNYDNFTLSNGTITTSGNTLVGYKVKVEPNTQYTQSTSVNLVSSGTHAIRLREYTTEPTNWNDNFIQQNSLSVSGTGIKHQTITTSATTQWLLYAVYSTATGDTFSDMQLELGDTATTYVEHQSQTYPINLPEGMFLGWIGDYKDYFYKDSGKWYLKKEIGKVVLIGSQDESYSVSAVYTNTNRISYLTTISNYSNTIVLSNYFKYATGNGDTPHIRFNDSGNLFFFIDKTLAPTNNDFKTWLSTHNTSVYYVLATPTTTEITNETLINQLDAIQNAMSYAGQTNISQVNNDIPFIISASALMKGGN